MNKILTFQDFQQHEKDRAKWIGSAIAQYMRSDDYKTAVDADAYEAERNTTINEYVRMVYSITGVATPDFTATNNRIASNFFHRLLTQRCSYSLGNGVSFASKTNERDEENKTIRIHDSTKDELGAKFDDVLYETGYNALKHKACYCFYNDGDYAVFPMTEFLAFPDELTGQIRAGVRFWSLDWKKRPVTVYLFEEDGISTYRTREGKTGLSALELIEKKHPYKETVQFSEADGEEVVGGNNYPSLPIAVMYGNKNKQSALVGMRANIDAYDLIHSGFANDLAEVAQAYWIINNASGMDDADIARLRDRLLLQHMAVADENNSTITPYTQEIPYSAREACLSRIEKSIFRDFGGLDVKEISAAAKTATEITAAYQPLDEEADAFEYQANEFIQQILALIGLEDTPVFDRNRIVNEKEETEMVLLAANYLDQETILKKLPFVTVDEVDAILARKDAEDFSTFTQEQQKTQAEQTTTSGEESAATETEPE